MRYFVTSDLHLGHFNIISYTNRPFKTIEEMNSTLIKNWNERIKCEDAVYYLGDFCFKVNSQTGNGINIKPIEYAKQLNGNIIYINGNHDRNNQVKSITESCVVKYLGKRMNLVHDPKYANENFEINLVGHVHEKWKFMKTPKGNFLINVSVDVWKYRPILFEEALSSLKKWRQLNGE